MSKLTVKEPEKSLVEILKYKAGRSAGKITTRHKGGRQKRFYRDIDFKRNKFGIIGRVVSFEYDPNRNVNLALIHYTDGEKRYILKPNDLKLGENIISQDT